MLGLFSLSWLALPLANAALDYVSLGASHSIGRLLVRPVAGVSLIVFGLLFDLVIAILFMVLTVAFVGLALTGITWGLGIETLGETFLLNSALDPWGLGLWLTIMALTTTAWTWLHLGLVVAPLAAGAIVHLSIERIAKERLKRADELSNVDVVSGALIPVRFVVFYGCWLAIAVSPLVILTRFPSIMEGTLWMGWRLFVFLA